MLLSEVIKDIKRKESLVNLDEEAVKERIRDYLRGNSLFLRGMGKRSREYKKLIKNIRGDLHKEYGVFQLDIKKREKYFNELRKYLEDHSYKDEKSLELHNKILKTHKSCRERIKIYPVLYKKIFRITGKPDKILDLSAGLNPFSFPYMALEKVEYIATELNKKDCKFIQDYFDLVGIRGKVIKLNLFNVRKLLKVDLVFIFKVFHTLEKRSFKLAEKVIKKLNSKFIIVSFSVKTIGNKKMNFPYFPGFERMLKRLKLKYGKLLLGNELFYVVEG